MSITLFFVDAFTSALERGIATPDALIRHITPDVLAAHLPRTLWARLLTACLGAARVDASTIVDTVGVRNLCEHLPKPLLWGCLADLAATALGGARPSTPAASPASPTKATTSFAAAASAPETLLPPPPMAKPAGTAPGAAHAESTGTHSVITSATNPSAAGAADSGSIFDAARTRTPTRPPARGLGTSRSLSAAGASSRRPQVPATPPTPPPGPTPAAGVPAPARPPARRDDLDFEVETDIHTDWKDKEPIPVTDEMVDWPSAEETANGDALDRLKR
ncbi:MAG: hypothetical protein IPI49_07260 [Myxococcales bacterium]|nr:hypothetical protein [Myxococcales bacterium]